jgi:membrane dipeptidase
MLHPGWVRGSTKPGVLGIVEAARHIDYVCQIAGTSDHAAIGSDLDRGFGTEQTPGDLETISDLHKIAGHLGDMGYGDDDIEKIFNRNWYEFFIRHLPKGE